MRTQLRPRRAPLNKKRAGIAVAAVLLAAVLGRLFLGVSHAAVYTQAIEAESGTVGTAKLVDNPAASGSKVVTFGAAGGGGTKVGGCIAPAGLKPTDLDAAHGGTDQIPPWPHKYGDAAVIYYAVSSLTTEYAGYIRDGAAVWNVSPCIDIRVVDICPAATNCVVAKSAADNGGSTYDGLFEGKGNTAYTYLTSGTITLVSSLLDAQPADYRKLVAIHEMGHSVSLGHRLTVNDLMNWSSDLGVPLTADTTNLNNILAIYGVQSPATAAHATEGGSDDGGFTVRQYE